MNLQIVEGDLVEQKVEVIVNAWNRNIIPWWLLIPQGVSGAIKRHGGLAPFIELGRKGPIPFGEAVETSAGRLPFRAIIHVAGINMLWRSSANAIEACTRNALTIAQRRSFASVAFPIIGAGTGGFSHDDALDLMRKACANHPYGGEMRIVKFKK